MRLGGRMAYQVRQFGTISKYLAEHSDELRVRSWCNSVCRGSTRVWLAGSESLEKSTRRVSVRGPCKV